MDSPERGEAGVLPPDDAFTLVGNETRLGILRALWEVHDPYGADDAVAFSELFDRVGADDTGNFNYHLGRLTGHFVRRTDAGYELAAPGFRIVRAIVAGAVTDDPTLAATPVGKSCPHCGGHVEVTHEDGTTWVRCRDCEGDWPRRDGTIFGFSLPPAGLRHRDAEGILAATIVYSMHRFESMLEGVCPACGGTVATTLAVCSAHDPANGVCDACDSRFLGVVTAVCAICKFAWRSPSYASISRHPALVSFYHDHGVEHVPSTWAAIARGIDWREELLSSDPASLRLTVRRDGDERRFVLDRTGAVVDVDTTDGADGEPA